MAEWKTIVSGIAMADWKRIVGPYVTFKEEKDHWTCKICQRDCTGRRCRVTAHLIREQGNGIRICQKITPELVEELKRKLGLATYSTGEDGQQPQQPGENDDIRQQNGIKKRKVVSGSGTSGSDPSETEMSPEQNSSFSDFASIWQEVVAATPGTSHDQERAYVPNTDNGGFQGTNAVGSSGLLNIIHDTPMGSSADEPQPPCPPSFNPDLWKLYLGIDSPAVLEEKFSLYKECMSSTDEEEKKVLLDSLEIACSEVGNTHRITGAPDLQFLSDYNRNAIQEDLHFLFYRNKLAYRSNQLSGQVGRVEEIEKEIRGETEQGEDQGSDSPPTKEEKEKQRNETLLRKRNYDKNRWVAYAATFKSDVDDFNGKNARSLQEILQLLSRAEELKKMGDLVIETGLSLLHPVPSDILTWNPAYMSCGSQMGNQNQVPPTQFTLQV